MRVKPLSGLLWMCLFLIVSNFIIQNSAHAQKAQSFEQRQEWELGCYNKIGTSCDSVALHWDAVIEAGGEPGVTAKQAMQRKMAWAKRGCPTGGKFSCDTLGWASEYGAETLVKDLAAAHRYYRQGCENGANYSCNRYAATYYYGIGVAQDRQRGFQLYQDACAVGNPYACDSLETARREMGTQDLNSVCQAGSSLACYRIALLQSHGENPDMPRASTYYHRTCFELSDPNGCLLYGVFLSDARERAIEDWQTTATRAFERACEIGIDEICASLQETGTDNYWKMTFAVMKQSCELGLVAPCWSITGRLTKGSWRAAAKYAGIGCDLGVPELCHNAGVIHLDHPGVVGDPYLTAVDYFTAGCRLGYGPSCDGQTYASNKSQMWRDVTFGSGQSGFEKFMSDLAYGIGQATAMGVPNSARSVPASPGVASSANQAQQDNRDFQNAVNAINNIGTGYNSTCPASNPYC